ncbi:hypothetical protein GQ53DRAFT_361443 [Thozetella sp. PMI_491]|nr:hypothetical protein GQ53DRAFT_361443 [Thozetella sp. PMI_491]
MRCACIRILLCKYHARLFERLHVYRRRLKCRVGLGRELSIARGGPRPARSSWEDEGEEHTAWSLGGISGGYWPKSAASRCLGRSFSKFAAFRHPEIESNDRQGTSPWFHLLVDPNNRCGDHALDEGRPHPQQQQL